MTEQKLGYTQDKPNKDLVYAQPRGYEFTYYLSDCVQDSHEYHEILQVLDNAAEGDLVRIIINNEGGEVGTCVQVIDHIRNCKGTVVGCISGNAFSAAGLIWISCHAQEVAEHSLLMIHGAVGYAGGKYSDMTTYITAANKRTRALYEDVFEYFLSKEELESVFKGEEMWLNYSEIVERLEFRQACYEEENKKAAEEQQAAMDAIFDEIENALPDAIVDKLSKAERGDYIKGWIDIDVKEDGTYEIIRTEKFVE